LLNIFCDKRMLLVNLNFCDEYGLVFDLRTRIKKFSFSNHTKILNPKS